MLKLIGVIFICLHSINCDNENVSTISGISSNFTFDLNYSKDIIKASAYKKGPLKVFNLILVSKLIRICFQQPFPMY